MRKIFVIIFVLIAQYSMGQSAEEVFNTAARSFIQNDIVATTSILVDGLKKHPNDKKIKALADKLGIEEKAVAVVEEKTPEVVVPVVKKDPKSEKTKALLSAIKGFSAGDPDLEKGEVLVCMFSLSCGHCQHAYKDLCAMRKEGKLPQVFLYNYGQEFDLNYFFTQAGDCKDSYVRMEDYTAFSRILEGESFPRVLAFKDGKIVKSWDIKTFTDKSVREFYGIKQKVEPKKNDGGINIEGGSGSQWGGGSSTGKQPWE